MTLFQEGNFTLSSGLASWWKVECDALTKSDWRTLADLATWLLGNEFKQVVGVPTGGEPFAAAIAQAGITKSGPTLVVDDVLTTGGSLLRIMEHYPGSVGLVAFARGPLPPSVHAIWSLAQEE